MLKKLLIFITLLFLIISGFFIYENKIETQKIEQCKFANTNDTVGTCAYIVSHGALNSLDGLLYLHNKSQYITGSSVLYNFYSQNSLSQANDNLKIYDGYKFYDEDKKKILEISSKCRKFDTYCLTVYLETSNLKETEKINVYEDFLYNDKSKCDMYVYYLEYKEIVNKNNLQNKFKQKFNQCKIKPD